jgi:hypothetical protein
MTVEETVKAVMETAEHWSYDVPGLFLRHSEDKVVKFMLDTQDEELQHYANEEWIAFLKAENDAVKAVQILRDWLADREQSIVRSDSIDEMHAAGESPFD